MSLKTAALIAFLGAAVRFCLAFSTMMLQLVGVRPFGPYQYQISWLFNMIFFGSLILFFGVFYSKQKQ